MTEYADAELGRTFAYAGVAAAYEHRAPYPIEVFDVLTGLIADPPSIVLDLGAGDGALARPPAGGVETAPVTFRQSVDDYVEHFHSTASLAREHMSTAEAAEFDRAVVAVVAPHAVDGMLELTVVATVRWGPPL